jgi:hypothetical protein
LQAEFDGHLQANATVICRLRSATQHAIEAVTSTLQKQHNISTASVPHMPPSLLNARSDNTTEFQLVLQQAEAAAYPAVFRGLNQSWPALQRWAGLQGLQHLQEAAGHATVQVRTGSASVG